MENPIKTDDLGGKPTIFGNIHMVHIPISFRIPGQLGGQKASPSQKPPGLGRLWQLRGFKASEVRRWEVGMVAVKVMVNGAGKRGVLVEGLDRNQPDL